MKTIFLGQKTPNITEYDASLLQPIPREIKRSDIGITTELPFAGFDLWRSYEFSFLLENGKPTIWMLRLQFDTASKNIIESKSLKIYLNSFSMSRFKDEQVVKEILINDLSIAVHSPVKVEIKNLSQAVTWHTQSDYELGLCIDSLDIACNEYHVNQNYLKTHDQYAHERLHSHLLRSNCLVTNQPDWGSVVIEYHGPQIDHGGLLQYLVSFREHQEFHEHCIERIFVDLLKYCQPQALLVAGYYTRRGGLDITPIRYHHLSSVGLPERLLRQ
jgi:7-cyano-7-deazaguanine reductase